MAPHPNQGTNAPSMGNHPKKKEQHACSNGSANTTTASTTTGQSNNGKNPPASLAEQANIAVAHMQLPTKMLLIGNNLSWQWMDLCVVDKDNLLWH
jgi:hypothetical protein